MPTGTPLNKFHLVLPLWPSAKLIPAQRIALGFLRSPPVWLKANLISPTTTLDYKTPHPLP
ncbi:MAG: hypothetical protein ACJA1W_003460 [Akkermansiaceae bacterium]|jgi:hypothetical protein